MISFVVIGPQKIIEQLWHAINISAPYDIIKNFEKNIENQNSENKNLSNLRKSNEC